MELYVLILIAGAIILGIVWRQSRAAATRAGPDRSLPGEAATAFEDIAEDIIRQKPSGHADADVTKRDSR